MSSRQQTISIHALREEGDHRSTPWIKDMIKFLSTPSARRATHPEEYDAMPRKIFLSTPSARRATEALMDYYGELVISIHALREEGDLLSYLCSIRKAISIHALREEGDLLHHSPGYRRSISIHALREEGDWPPIGGLKIGAYFYPRPPRGGRRWDSRKRSS